VRSAPILILLPAASGLGNQLSVLGLGLVQRATMAARRAGYDPIILSDHDAPSWRVLAAAMRLRPPLLVVAPDTILAESNWLEQLGAMQIGSARWAAIPHRIAVVAGAAAPDALTALQAPGAAHDMTAVQDHLTRRLGTPAAVPIGIDPMLVLTPKDVPAAERRMLRSLIKKTDGFMARHFDRHISLQISRRLAATTITPTQVTMISIAIGLIGALCFLSSVWYWQTVGALLFLLHSIVDGCDGELARLKFQESRCGGMLDFWGDNVVLAAIFACMAVGWTLSSRVMWPLGLGASAIACSLGSAFFVYWRQMRVRGGAGPLFTSVASAPDDRLAGMLDAASRRDFVYLMPVLALFGQARLLLLLAAAGAPIFFLLLLYLEAQERSRALTGK
jgi:1L-myo-inositol 1-phosphate cytidylyltransferase / CDP-L-myo-inositol myo-inositolphosphotransferase